MSDNGQIFKAAAKAIQVVMESREVQEHLSELGVVWKFNIERAPGGEAYLNKWFAPPNGA